jgi:imidazole glycerol-phosphate synthase subunit HisH
MRTVALIDYGSGNLRSAEKALWAAARLAGQRRDIRATCEPDFVAQADAILLPGVGAFRACMAALTARPGLIEALNTAVIGRGVPFLGVCVGMQLLATRGLEFGETPGLGWIEGEVKRLAPHDRRAKVPHVGWNEVQALRPHPLLGSHAPDSQAPDSQPPDSRAPGTHMYFTHSYAFHPAEAEAEAARTDHGGPVCAMVVKNNIAGVQFHPEKSQAAGLALIARFLEWRP